VKPPTGKYARRTTNNCFIKTEFKTEETVVKSDDIPQNKELARLAFFGAGPKLPGKYKISYALINSLPLYSV